MSSAPLVALVLTEDAARGLATADSAVIRALDETHARGAADILVLGADTVTSVRGDVAPRVRALDPVMVSVARHARFPRWGFLAVAAPTRDHPYNLARRVLGADHMTEGRVGLVLADDDAGLPLDPGGIPWLPGSAPGMPVTDDAADAVRELWNSWPAGTIVADRETGRYARIDEVRAIDRHGLYRIAGPLGTPASGRGEPVLGHLAVADGEPGRAWAEVVLSGAELRIAGSTPGSILVVRDTAQLAALPSRAAAPDRRTLRDILGLPPRSLALTGRRPYAETSGQTTGARQ